MKGKNTFNASEINLIKRLVDEKNKAPADKQKGIRQKIRDIGFYYTDFSSPPSGYSSIGIEELIRSGQIKVIGNYSPDQAKAIHPSNAKTKSKKKESQKNMSSEFELNYKIIDELQSFGFRGFKKMSELFDNCSCIPKVRGVYFVLNLEATKPEFIESGTGGFFKGKNPNIPIAELISNWVNETIVVYIGKAGSLGGSSTLYKRLRQYLFFGQGNNVGHYGGRLIWQLKNSSDLILCWKELPKDDPDAIETKLIGDFKTIFGKRPFANLTK